jgi:predicted kinase
MIGPPGAGKSTWIAESNLNDYAVSLDEIRNVYFSKTMDINGNFSTFNAHDDEIWKTFVKVLESKMEEGQFIVIDNTNTKDGYIDRYRNICSKFGYKLYGKRFNVPLDELIKRNLNRSPRKAVPSEIVEIHHRNFLAMGNLSKKLILIDDINEVDEFVKISEINEKTHVIGDIHGCFNPLKRFLDETDIKKDFFIFLGDYIDRGTHDREVVELLSEFAKKKNFIFLEGNHEKWLKLWAENREKEIKSPEFNESTIIKLNGINKNKVKNLTSSLKSYFAFKSGNKKFICCHGGIPTDKFDFINAKQLISGVGAYKQSREIAENFEKNSESNSNLIHGHRNIYNDDIKVSNRVFNLEGKIEFGGELRVLTIINGEIEEKKFSNNSEEKFEPKTNIDIIEDMKRSRYVNEKDLGNGISSFNFTRDAFHEKEWNETTTKARGLFIRQKDNKMIARSYDKFFNIGERVETTIESLKEKFVFPVTAFKKENGYLGIVGFDEEKNELVICSKSTTHGDFAEWFRKFIFKKPSLSAMLKQKCAELNSSFVFEVVMIEKDPHIIKYNKDEIYLLDIIKNDFIFSKLPYDELEFISQELGVKVKTKLITLFNWVEFEKFYNEISFQEIEGVVYEDSNFFMVKQKTEFYNFWKKMRNVRDAMRNNPMISSVKFGDENMLKFAQWLKSKDASYLTKDIISLRKEYLVEK